MSLTDALCDLGELGNRGLERVPLAVRRRGAGVARDHREARIAQSIRFEGQLTRQASERAVVRLQLGVLDRVDPLGQADHESVDGLDQLGHVFLGRSDGRLSFRHGAGDIGRGPAKLERPTPLARSARLTQAPGMQCHACRQQVALASGESVGYRDACDRCSADLHVCLNCAHHDPTAYNECRESSAERILDRDRANRCDYFRPRTGSALVSDERERAKASLEALFKKG